MNRIIKFRAWDKKEKVMFVPDGLKNPIDFSKNFVHMQFTGLLDKDGKEIYEGDIIQHILGILEPLALTPGEQYEVIFFYGSFKGFRMGATSDNVPDFSLQEMAKHYAHLRNFKVIGNIHQNPELL